jgi:Peptidase family M28
MSDKQTTGPTCLLSPQPRMDAGISGDGLRRSIECLAHEIGERHVGAYTNLCRAADFIEQELRSACLSVGREIFTESRFVLDCANVIGEAKGTDQTLPTLVVGAHYDTVAGTPGANDNASGIAVMLELAKWTPARHFARTVRFVAFANEEEPYFDTPSMGSHVHAESCMHGETEIMGALVLECVGCFNAEAGSQRLPFPLSWWYPDRADFLMFVGDPASWRFVRRAKCAFSRGTDLRTFSMIAPMSYRPARLSDHFSFYRRGIPAVMISDTGPYRSNRYHRSTDTIDGIDFHRMESVVLGMKAMLQDICG